MCWYRDQEEACQEALLETRNNQKHSQQHVDSEMKCSTFFAPKLKVLEVKFPRGETGEVCFDSLRKGSVRFEESGLFGQ